METLDGLLDGYALLDCDRAVLLEWARWEAVRSTGAVLAAALLLVKHRAAQVAAMRAG